jgi:vanillate O-demethylase monooxygenase subunit
VAPPNAVVPTYPTHENMGLVWVWMGDPALADEALIPPAVGLDHPDYILGHGQLDYEAEARLINDNLLDFSHLAYVHTNSFGVAPEFAQSLPKLEPLDRGVRYSRWTTDTFGQPSRKSDVPIDTYMNYDFLIPGVLLMWSGKYARGTARSLDFAPPRMADAQDGVTFTSQAVTPLTEKTSRYFFSWGPHRDHGDEALRDALMDMAAMAFGEDKVMIEAQQRIIDRTRDSRIMPTAHDKGVTLFNRLVERMAKQDATPVPTEKSACR